jgi:UDP-N-acetylglucosamine--N-acetylmuramyl-(pentapeptide) pyrophosphoryl-undecaprenol N-acetylglucosamine transferase
VKEYGDYERLQKLQQTLSAELQPNYIVTPHFLASELGYVYSIADVVISRAGANTFFELLTLQKPTLFIPLPWSAYGEQQKQAELFHTKGIGEVFDQARPSEELFLLIEKMMHNLSMYQEQFTTLSFPDGKQATKTIVETIVKK